MTLKSITLHRAAVDNTGRFNDAGTELQVGDAVKPKTITADRANALIHSHGARGHHAAAASKPKSAGKTRLRKSKTATKPKAVAPQPEQPESAPLADDAEPTKLEG